jgi:hypothetical protein
MKSRFIAAAGSMLAVASMSASAQVQINEIRIDQPSTDTDEYFELCGAPGTDLTGMHYLVIGDGSSATTGTCGGFDGAVDLTGMLIPASGILLVAEVSPLPTSGATPDYTASLPFENGDGVTHMLVSGWVGTTADDLDTDDDGVFDVTPWAAVHDHVSFGIGSYSDGAPRDDSCLYGTTGAPIVAGPQGATDPGGAPPDLNAFSAAHIYRNGNACDGDPAKAGGGGGSLALTTWTIGEFDPAAAGADDTPGGPNPLGGIHAGQAGNMGMEFRGGTPGNFYFVLGSVPPFPGIPADPYLLFTLNNPNTLIFPSLFVLDGGGNGNALWGPAVAQGFLAPYVGAIFDHIVVELDGGFSVVGASNTVLFEIKP